jgi:beta-lactamase class D
MKKYSSLILLAIFFCQIAYSQKQEITNNKTKPQSKELSKLKQVFDDFDMNGSFLISNQQKNEYLYYNKKRAEKGYLPASTFKIPNTIIGLETGVINSETVFIWDSTERRLDAWEKDLKLREAFQVSCVPCYQDIARKIGVKNMREYLDKYKYGKMKFDESTIDNFWLEGESKITSYEQIEFLKKFYEDQLNLKHSTKAIMLEIMRQEAGKNYKLYGKTGWSVRNGNNYGWFVGFLETPGNVYFFAVNMEPKDQKKTDEFVKNRKEVAILILKRLGLIK